MQRLRYRAARRTFVKIRLAIIYSERYKLCGKQLVDGAGEFSQIAYLQDVAA